MENKKIKFVCPECGSDDVGKDAYAFWDTDAQEWALGSTYDNMTCQDCGYESDYNFSEVEVNDEEITPNSPDAL